MIRAEAKVIGTVKRSASIRTDRNGNPYLSLVMAVSLPDARVGSNTIDVFVSVPNAGQNEARSLVEGARLAVTCSLDIRKKSEQLSFYLTGNGIDTWDVSGLDAVSGTLSFRGYLKKDKLYQQKTDKKGRPYFVFSAYSLEKHDDAYATTWVNFMIFPKKRQEITSLIPSWFHAKARLNVTGDLQVSSYNGNVRLSSRVTSMEESVNAQQ